MGLRDDITIINLRKLSPLLDEENIQILGEQLFDLIDKQDKKIVLLNFDKVVFVSSGALGKLFALNKKLQAAGGKLVMCTVPKDILEIFEVTKLDKFFKIYPDQLSALSAL